MSITFGLFITNYTPFLSPVLKISPSVAYIFCKINILLSKIPTYSVQTAVIWQISLNCGIRYTLIVTFGRKSHIRL